MGIKIQDKVLGTVGFITWGRVFDRIDAQSLLDAVAKNSSKFGIQNLEKIELCDSLQDLSAFPYFYEALFAFAQENIQYGKKYEDWCAKKQKAILQGEDIYFLGIPKRNTHQRMPGSISHGFYVKP